MTLETPAPTAESSLEADMLAMGRRARAASRTLALAGADARTKAIKGMASALRGRSKEVLAANAADLDDARAKGMADAMMDRLALDEKRLAGVVGALESIAAIPDPVGVETARWTPENGLDIARVRTPLGVLAIIYESRPNVTADAAALAVRAGNAVILRGGSECLRSNLAIHEALVEGLTSAGLSPDTVQIVTTRDRAAVGQILTGLDGSIDLLIPRGGRSLVERVKNEARVAVLGHLEGVNHVYVHASADPDMARAVAVNAKMRRVSVCGAAETLLIDKAVADDLLPRIAADLTGAGCELRADPAARALIPGAAAANDDDWATEYLKPILAVKVVDGMDEALDHVARYGSGHTESIVASDEAAIERFLAEADAGIVLANASTQFADGGEFGFGGEIGISTDRLHARGPVGAEQLTSFKYVVRGKGQTRP
ncbi:glutamate-5-semialdehyde dehydrogenase [Brevundimonas basaltis]|uniref:Gamma-glutamyl phosphate reductase n=2 Tax=Brevundimonas basaltis TaxID=472166 RepID=A0A7W8HX52_9CAUL|nr:glutamate-5-semialdehyde dehydrogenase [Brevundimonas basaltis]MBB5291528.1 glutamate-5-semialdehyde dehydrogenase [Brevundimonas basaltis]